MWRGVTRIILRYRVLILVVIALLTVFAYTQTKNIKYSYEEAKLLPDDDVTSVNYQKFKKMFGEEATMIVMGTSDSMIYTPEMFKKWDQLSKDISNLKPEDLIEFTTNKKAPRAVLADGEKLIKGVISVSSMKVLEKDKENKKFNMIPLLDSLPTTTEEISAMREKLYSLPFYEKLLYSKESGLITTSIIINPIVLNSETRVDLVKAIKQEIDNFEAETGIDIHISGMPYIRTYNSATIIKEVSNFVYLAMLITAFIFFLFFRSFSATLIAAMVVTIAVVWSFGTIGFFGYNITILTGLIPPLIIVIGFPNVIFLLNKFHQEYALHGNKIKSISRIVTKIGNATLLTNTTTALGFGTFIFTNSDVMKEFGIVASINILGVFLLSILLVPIIYSFRSVPKKRHLKHLDKQWTKWLVDWVLKVTQNNRPTIYAVSIFVLVLSIVGMYQMKISGSIIDDMPKGAEFYKDIKYFENEYEGVMPLEILIDTRKKGGVYKASTLKRIEKMGDFLLEEPGLSKSFSIVNLIKYSKQAFYNNNPKYYQLPTTQERSFILDYAKNSTEGKDGAANLESFVDSTGRYARITLMMQDMGTDQMEVIEVTLQKELDKVFPKEHFDAVLTGGALVFLQGTHYLVKNLLISLGLAILIISLIMAWMFRSPKMILISLIPNLLPLLITAGLMGFFGVPIKVSTILVFSIAFGISVDDTIHFLAKYRQELVANKWNIKVSVLGAIEETGKSMFYTSIVLFFGFLTFTLSSFGGTKALGSLVSLTLLVAMIANLVLLPSLLLSLAKRITNKEDFKEPIVALDDDLNTELDDKLDDELDNDLKDIK
ncbi:MAG: MMPL family transporter [Ichthyobacteriaceae bacterium]|nr:MMPL family transporter [Ichthyobacteriaceae bacterium]